MFDIKIPLSQLNIAAISNHQSFESNKPKVIFLHGWLDNAASFTDVLPAFNDYHVIAIDWPGHGMSDHKSKGAYYHFVDWVDDLYQLLKVIGWDKVHLVGHSMGGMIATAFSAAFPDLIHTLSVIDAFGIISDDEKNTTKQIKEGIESRFKQQNKSTKYHPDLASAVKARLAVSDFSIKEAKLIVERGVEQTENGVVWRTDSRLRNVSPYRFTFGQAKQLMSDVQVPMLLIYGDKGMAFVSKMLEKFKPLVPQLEAIKLVGGHHVHMEQPDKTASYILSFISAK